MHKNNNEKQNSIYLEQKQLQSILSNRKHLDFALKLALGSQAYLHDISQIKDGSIMSFQSIQNQLSPLKSQYQSPLSKRAKKSRFGAKQNINSRQVLSLQKSILSNNSPQQKCVKQKLLIIQHWIDYIKQHHKFVSQLKTSKISQKTGRLSQKSKFLIPKNINQDINNFFKQVVYRLQKLQIIQKQEYNSKLLLCQLTQSSIRQYELQQKIQFLTLNLNKINQQVQIKTLKVDELQTIIKQLRQALFNKNPSTINPTKNLPSLQISNKTSSYLGFSISDLTQSNQNYVPSTSSLKLKNKIQSSLRAQNNLQISQSPQRSIKQNCKDIDVPDTAIQTHRKQKNCISFSGDIRQNNSSLIQDKQNSFGEESMLLNSIQIKKSQKLKPCRLFQQEGYANFQNNNEVSQKQLQTQNQENNQREQIQENEFEIKNMKLIKDYQKRHQSCQQSFNESVNHSKSDQQLSLENLSQQDLYKYLDNNCNQQSNLNEFGMEQIKQEVKQLIQQNQNLKNQLNKLSQQINYLRDTKNYDNFIQLPLLANVNNDAQSEGINQHEKKVESVQQKIPAMSINTNQNNQQASSHFITTNTSKFNITHDLDANKTIQIQSNKTCQTQRIRKIGLASNVIEYNYQLVKNKNNSIYNFIGTSTEASLTQSAKLISYADLQTQKKHLEDKVNYLEEENRKVRKQIDSLIDLCEKLEAKNQSLENKLAEFQDKFQESQRQADQIQQNLHHIVQNQNNLNLLKLQKSQSLPQKCLNTQINTQNKSNKNSICNPQSKKSLSILIQKHKLLIQKLKKRTQQLNHIKGIMKKAKQINQKDIEYLKITIQKHKQSRLNQLQNLRRMEFEWKQKFISNKNRQLQELKLKGNDLKLKLNRTIFKFAKSGAKNKKRNA